MSTDLQVYDQSGVINPQQNMAMNPIGEVLARAAAAQVQSRIVSAIQRPRDVMVAYKDAMKEVEIYRLAESAVYSFSRGGQVVSGPTIDLMIMIARHWRNMDFEWAEIHRGDGYSILQSWCIDLESNLCHRRTFQVSHIIDTKKGPKPLKEERDIRENNANIGTRNMRACIEKMIPVHIIEDVVEKAKAVAANGDKKQPWEVRLTNMLMGFDKLGVTKEMLEKRLKHEWKLVNEQEFVEYYHIIKSLEKGDAKREEFFPEFISEDKTTVQEFNANGAKTAEDNKRADLLQKIATAIDAQIKSGVEFLALEDRVKMSLAQDALAKLKTVQLQAVFEALSKKG